MEWYISSSCSPRSPLPNGENVPNVGLLSELGHLNVASRLLYFDKSHYLLTGCILKFKGRSMHER